MARVSLTSSSPFLFEYAFSGGKRLSPHSVAIKKKHVVSKQGRFLELNLGKGKEMQV